MMRSIINLFIINIIMCILSAECHSQGCHTMCHMEHVPFVAILLYTGRFSTNYTPLEINIVVMVKALFDCLIGNNPITYNKP